MASKEGLQLPKYLTEGIAARAVLEAVDEIFKGDYFVGGIGRDQFQASIVVLVPAVPDDRQSGYANWPVYPPQPFPLVQIDFGTKSEWKYGYGGIAQCKAQQRWYDRSADTYIMPHLLVSGETPYYGAVKMGEIVVACSSNTRERTDWNIAELCAIKCIEFARIAWEQSEERANLNLEFLA